MTAANLVEAGHALDVASHASDIFVPVVGRRRFRYLGRIEAALDEAIPAVAAARLGDDVKEPATCGFGVSIVLQCCRIAK